MSTGYNHHRTHYDGADLPTRGHRKPVSMHAEMHAIFSLTGMSPSFRTQHGARTAATAADPQRETWPLFKGAAPPASREGHPWRVQGTNALENACC
ncbi:hypothetical protein FA95DRAFT_1565144, partial [Auriscalpium vulgare]